MQLVSSAAMIVLVAGLGWNDVADVQVKTTGGMVRGAAMADGRIRVFKGIPYAAPPVGELRWKAPQPARHGRARARPPSSARNACRARSSTTSTFRGRRARTA